MVLVTPTPTPSPSHPRKIAPGTPQDTAKKSSTSKHEPFHEASLKIMPLTYFQPIGIVPNRSQMVSIDLTFWLCPGGYHARFFVEK